MKQVDTISELSISELSTKQANPGAGLNPDIAAKIHQETIRALRESSRLHRVIFEDAWYGIGIVDFKGNFLECNTACCRMLGYSKEELLGKKVKSVMPESHHYHIFEFQRQVAEQGSFYLESKAQRKTGEIFPLEISGSLLTYCGKKAILGFVRDITQRQEAVDALKESQRILSTLMSNMPGIAYRCRNDKDWSMVYVSEGCYELTGYPAKDLTSKKILYADIVSPEYRPYIEQEINEALEQKRPFRLVYPLKTAEGVERWVWEQGCGIFSPEGEWLALEGFITDITERKTANQALKESEELHRSIFENAWDSIALINSQGFIVECNPAFCRMLGYARHEVINKHIKKCIHPEHRHKWDDFWPEIEKDNISQVYVESVDVKKNGTPVDVEISSALLTVRGEQLVLATMRDITERKRAREQLEISVQKRTEELCYLNQQLKAGMAIREETEHALRTSKERYRSLVRTIPHGVDEINIKGDILFANPALHRLYGCKEGELIGKSIFERVSTEEEREALYNHLQYLAKEQPEPHPYFGKKITADGREIEVQVDWDYNRDADGKVIGFSTVVTNITERKKSEEKLREQAAELAHVSRVSMLGEMATGIAHELNQPLAAIVNFTRGCIRRLQAPDCNREDLVAAMQQVVTESERAASVIQRMRDFVKKGELVQKNSSINTIILESLHLFDFEVERSGVEVWFDPEENLPEVCVDQIQISQVLVNIIKNAIEAVKTNPVGERNIKIDVGLAKGIVKIWIKNNGPALSPELAKKIFDPFFTTKSDGMGMGLSISRTIIEAHGGLLKLYSDEPGACFCIMLPVAKQRESHGG